MRQGLGPQLTSTTASSNSPVPGSPVRENAKAPAAVSGALPFSYASSRRFSRGGRLPILSLARHEIAFLVPVEGERDVVGDVDYGARKRQLPARDKQMRRLGAAASRNMP